MEAKRSGRRIAGLPLLFVTLLCLCSAVTVCKAQTLGAGKVYAWGRNYEGELGNDTFTTTYPYSIATPGLAHVPANVKVVAIAGGNGHSLALTDDGRVYAWRLNGSGQLGNSQLASGTSEGSATPGLANLPGNVKFVAIAAGGFHSLALTKAQEKLPSRVNPTPFPE